MPELVLLRHGETAWSRDGRHTGLTDIPLTGNGERAAAAFAAELGHRAFALVLASPSSRCARTAALAGLRGVRTETDLHEWDYGGYEGRTTPDIRAERPGWYLWSDGVPPGGPGHPGETVEQVGQRCDRVLEQARGALRTGDVVLVGHGHTLRVLIARWLGLGPSEGRLFGLATATLSALGFEHGRPVVRRLNVPPAGTRA